MEEVLLTGTDREDSLVSFLPPHQWQADADGPEGGFFNMAQPRQTPASSLGKRRRLTERPVDLNSFFCKELPSRPRFLLMSCVEEGKTLKSVSSCRLARELDKVIGNAQSISRLRNGTMLIEGRTDAQIELVLSIKNIAGLQVKVEPHPTLNLCKGVVSHDDFASESDEDLKTFFEPEGVVNVHRLRKKVNGTFVPSTILILTFNRPTLPERITCGYFNLRVRQYVPNPLRCYKCQRFGHTQERCMSHSICVNCGQKAHESSECQSPPHCINCNGPHGSNSRDCPKFEMEREIQKIRVIEKISFPEARRRYQAQHPVDFSRSFVSVLKSTAKDTITCRSVQCQASFPQTPSTVCPKNSATYRSIACQASLTSIIGDKHNVPCRKTVSPSKSKPDAEAKNAGSGSSSHKSSIAPQLSSSSVRFSAQSVSTSPLRNSKGQGSRSKSRSPVGHSSLSDSLSDPDDPGSLMEFKGVSQSMEKRKNHRRRKK